MELLNFLFSFCLLMLNGNKSIVGGSLVIHAGALKAKNGTNCPKSGYFGDLKQYSFRGVLNFQSS